MPSTPLLPWITITTTADGYDPVLFGTADGYGPDGRDAQGYDRNGYDQDGRDCDGYDRDGWDRDGYDRQGLDEDNCNRDGDYYCSDCESAPCDCEEEEFIAVDYNMRDFFCPTFNPEIKFRGKGPLYFGMELEITARTREHARIAHDAVGDLAWLKSDCSVSGFEMATQPMSYPYFQREFPWGMLTELESAGCEVQPASNGMHIHVSRDGFSGVPHQYRWMKLIYRNKRNVVRIGGRESDQWGAFTRSTRQRQGDHLKIRKLRAEGKHVPRNLFNISSRYDAINTLPSHTFEIRAFASTLSPDTARARLQLAAASVEYTRRLTARDVTQGAWEWPAFAGYVKDHRTVYPQLAKVT